MDKFHCSRKVMMMKMISKGREKETAKRKRVKEIEAKKI